MWRTCGLPVGRALFGWLSIGLVLPLLFAAAGPGHSHAGEESPAPADYLDGISGPALLAQWQGLSKALPSGGSRWIQERMLAVGLQPVGETWTYAAPVAAEPAARGPGGDTPERDAAGNGAGAPSVLGHLPGTDPRLAREAVVVGTSSKSIGCAVLLHLAGTLTANSLRPRRRLIFCAFGGEHGAGARAIAARPPFKGEIVAMLDVGQVGGSPALSIAGVGAYPVLGEHLVACVPEGMRAQVEFRSRAPHDGAFWPFHERGMPAVRLGDDGGGAPTAAYLAAAARLLGTLTIGLANSPDPLADPLGVASYLVQEGPRFAEDDLVPNPDGSVRIRRQSTHAERMKSGLSALMLTIPEDLDPAATWRALERMEAGKGPVRYRLVRRAADIARAYAAGQMAILPRLCCAQAAHTTPGCLAKFAALGYRWLAPWSTGVVGPYRAPAVERIASAAKKLGVLIDAGGLPPERHAELRRALGDRPAILLERRPLEGAGLGALTLPLVRFRKRMTWVEALGSAPGLAPPVVFVPRGKRLAEKLAAWGHAQPAGWDAPGSPQRTAIRATLGGRLIEWLARTER